MPTRNARNGCLFTSGGRVIIKQAQYRDDPRPIDENCLVTRADVLSGLSSPFISGG